MSGEDSHGRRFVFVIIGGFAVAMGGTSGLPLHALGGMTLKAFSRCVKFTYGMFKGVRAVYAVKSVQNPLQGLLLAVFAAKTLAKGASKGILVKAQTDTFKMICKGLKASEGALNLVRYSTDLHAAGWDALVTGYKLFKSAFNVVEGIEVFGRMQLEESGLLAGLEKGIKMGLDNIGVIVKAFTLLKQVQGMLLHRAQISKEAFEVLLEDIKKLTGVYGNSKKVLCFSSAMEHKPLCLKTSLRTHKFSSSQDRSLIRFLSSSFHIEDSEGLEYLLYLSMPLNVDVLHIYNSMSFSGMSFISSRCSPSLVPNIL
eukprot:TRINITY_DN11410_c0_g1_i1.p1 TRINITY_DN11410_c0_g1~~TRINITY_DN11410_c0_g1_i1.p1  ORF type:complete len:313 (+),score=39.20 TRINITY_DN11410_c0_g1_i1:305-1243(+)